MSLRSWAFKNELLVYARCYFSEIHLFFVRFIFGTIFDCFWMVLGAILGAKTVPKWVQKSIKILMDFWIAPGRALGRQRRPAHLCPAREGDHGEG